MSSSLFTLTVPRINSFHMVVVQTLATLRKKSKSVIMFAGFLKYRLSPDVYNYLARLDVEVSL